MTAARPRRPVRRLVAAAFGLAFLASGIGLFLVPEAIVVFYLITDDGLRRPGTSSFALALHLDLSPQVARWARERVASGAASGLDVDDIAATEWPLFGSVFFLRATEALHDVWQANPDAWPADPAVASREAIDASLALVLDPNHAHWVREHWGETAYLQRGNCFYRMLVISALTSHHRLTGDPSHLPELREHVERLATEIDRSPAGLIEDYPGQCYPSDVAAAVAAIRRADPVLGTDHHAFAQRALRGFTRRNAGPLGLPPFAAQASTGRPLDASRGSSNAWLTTEAPHLWPDQAAAWFAAWEESFWIRSPLVAGVREFPRPSTDADPDPWLAFDVDAGPVIRGLGTSASAFGLGAARANGRFDLAFPLATELLAASWPLPGGTLVVPRTLSTAASNGHAPHLGECAILFQLTRNPPPGIPVTTGGRVPLAVVALLTAYFIAGLVLTRIGWRLLRGRPAPARSPRPRPPRAAGGAGRTLLLPKASPPPAPTADPARKTNPRDEP